MGKIVRNMAVSALLEASPRVAKGGMTMRHNKKKSPAPPPEGLTTKKAGRDSSIELLRVYACLMVVWAHIQISYHPSGDTVNMVSLTIKALIGDNVPLFLLIVGFFLFHSVQGPDRLQKIPGVYLDKLKGFLVRTYIPTILVTLIACFAGEFFYREKTFVQLFTQPHMNWEYLKNYLLLQSPSDMVGQFWYIIEYIKIMVFFPFLALICVDERPYTLVRRAFMGLSFLNICLSDIRFLSGGFPLLKLEKYALNEYFLYVLLGYELSLFFRKTRLSRQKQLLLSLAVFFSGVALRLGLSLQAFRIYDVSNSGNFMGLNCFPAYISSAGCLMVFHCALQGFHSKAANYLGGLTFYVYMFHGMTLRLFAPVGDRIRAALSYGATGGQSFLYYLLYGAVIFLSALLISIPAKLLYDTACRRISAFLQIKK